MPSRRICINIQKTFGKLVYVASEVLFLVRHVSDDAGKEERERELDDQSLRASEFLLLLRSFGGREGDETRTRFRDANSNHPVGVGGKF